MMDNNVKNNWPVIGIFTQPSRSTYGNCGGDCLYLAASYAKYIEFSGGRVVPINYYSSEDDLDELFHSLNGFFYPGGANILPASAQYIFDKTVAANDAGDYMPLWGTCLGFEWLLIAAARNESILDGIFDASNYSVPLDFTAAAPTSRLFEEATTTNIYNILATENVTMNNHHFGIYPDHMLATPSLSNFYSILSTNKDRQGVEFVSSIEAFDYPIYGTQWHPEKNIFEWGITTDGVPKEAINHSPHAIAVAQYTADFFVQLCRNSTHKFSDSNVEINSIIENYQATRTYGSFISTYFFDNSFSSFSSSSPPPSPSPSTSSNNSNEALIIGLIVGYGILGVLGVCVFMLYYWKYIKFTTGKEVQEDSVSVTSTSNSKGSGSITDKIGRGRGSGSGIGNDSIGGKEQGSSIDSPIHANANAAEV